MKKLIKKLFLCIAVAAGALSFTFAPVAVSADDAARTVENNSGMVDNSLDNETIGEEFKTIESFDDSGLKPEEKITLDDLITLVGQIAEQEGVDEWQSAKDNIRLALSEKKLDVVIALEIVKLCVLSAYVSGKAVNRIKKRIQAKKHPSTLNEDVQSIKQSSATQTKAVNEQTKAIKELKKTDEEIEVKVEKGNKKLNALAAAQIGTNEAIRCLIRGVGMSGTVKDEAYRSLNNSNEYCDKTQK